VRSLTPCAMVASMTVAALGLAAAIPASASASNALNGRIAYTTHGINGTGEIVTIDPDGAAPLRLTENPGYDAQADWAPDGLDLVYRSTPTTTGFEVWRMDRYGEHETRLTFGQSLSVDAYSSSQPAWFPDKSRILFRASGGPFAHAPIFSMAPEPGAEKQLAARVSRRAVARLRRPERERPGERVGLGGGKHRETVGDRREQVRQARERKLGLAFHSPRPQQADVPAAARGQRVEQRGLADARVTTQDQCAPTTGEDVGAKSAERGQLPAPADEHEPSRCQTASPRSGSGDRRRFI
jgi:dipeptidyl aminopeptidase/acylaminoacyl peptidase